MLRPVQPRSDFKPAISAQRAAVELLAGFEPTPALRLGRLLALAGGRQTLITWLIADQQIDAAAALAGQTVTDYQTYAAEQGADLMLTARGLGAVAQQLRTAGLLEDADAVEQALSGLGG